MLAIILGFTRVSNKARLPSEVKTMKFDDGMVLRGRVWQFGTHPDLSLLNPGKISFVRSEPGEKCVKSHIDGTLWQKSQGLFCFTVRL